jgi:hypothetical protein
VRVTWENLWTIEGLVAAGTLILALATAGLAVATVRLGQNAKRQVKIAADHVVAIQRPLVTPIVPAEGGQSPRRIRLKNVGLGPAYNIKGGLYWLGGAGGASAFQTTALGTGEHGETAVLGEGIQIAWENASGYLRYLDSAGTEWQTHFRFRDVPTAGIDVETVEVGRTSELGEPRYSPEGRANQT